MSFFSASSAVRSVTCIEDALQMLTEEAEGA
jgi:hypothetical protein